MTAVSRNDDRGHAVVGLCTVHLLMRENHSLKEKRGIVKSILGKVGNRFNVSIAEVGRQDSWQSAVLGIAVVSNRADQVDRVLDKVVKHIQANWPDAELVDYEVELL